MLNNNNVKIAMLEISDQNKAILDFYFASVGQDYYTVVNEDQADAFIMDYDYPNAKDHLTQIQIKNKKPVVIISITEQSIPVTVWLAKPLSAQALTDAAAKLKQMMVEKEEINATSTSDSSIATGNESLSLKTDLAEEVSNEDQLNVVTTDSANELEFAQSSNKEKKTVTSLTMEKAASLASTTFDDDEAEQIENNDVEEDRLFKDVNDTDSEDEVDSILDSLMLDEENDATTEATDSLLEELSLKTAADSENDDESKQIEITEQSLMSNDDKDELSLENSFEENVSNDVETEKESILLDENFTIHDDINPSTEDTYAETLEVDFSDVKSDVKKESAENDNSNKNEISENLETEFEANQFSLDSHELDESTKSLEGLTEDSLHLESDEEDLEKDDLETDLDSLLKEVRGISEDSIVEKTVEPSVDSTPDSLDVTIINQSFSQGETEVEKESDFELQSLLNEIRDEAGKNTDNGDHGLDSSSNTKSGKANAYEKTNAEKRWIQICGDHKGIENQKEISDISYVLSNHLLAVLIKQVDLSKNQEHVYRIKYNDLIIVLDHSKNQIYCNFPLDDDKYAAICCSELNLSEIKIHDLDYSEIRLYRKNIEENPDRAHTIESFIWTSSLLTSKGRLEQTTDVNKVVGLKAWPNLTRLELMPHAMQIAAVFSKHPASLLDIPKLINVEQRYVFAFYNAASTLNLIESDSSKLKKAASFFNKNESKEKKEERGFFGRLLNRLKS